MGNLIETINNSDFSTNHKQLILNRLIRKITNADIRKLAREIYVSKKAERDDNTDMLINEIIELSTKVRSLQAKLGYRLNKEVELEKTRLRKEQNKYFNMQQDLKEYEWKKDRLDEINERELNISEKERNYTHKIREANEKCEEFIKNNEEIIIKALSDELIRWTEENDIDNQRSQGYVIGINKAKKVVRETYENKTISSISGLNPWDYVEFR